MLAGPEIAQTTMGNGVMDEHIQDLLQIGAIHDHAVTRESGFHPIQMHDELCRLHGEAIKEGKHGQREGINVSASNDALYDAVKNQRSDRPKDDALGSMNISTKRQPSHRSTEP